MEVDESTISPDTESLSLMKPMYLERSQAKLWQVIPYHSWDGWLFCRGVKAPTSQRHHHRATKVSPMNQLLMTLMRLCLNLSVGFVCSFWNFAHSCVKVCNNLDMLFVSAIKGNRLDALSWTGIWHLTTGFSRTLPNHLCHYRWKWNIRWNTNQSSNAIIYME